MTDIKYLKESRIWENMDADAKVAIEKAYDLFDVWTAVSMTAIFNEVLDCYDTFRYCQSEIAAMSFVLGLESRFTELKDIMNLIATSVKRTTEVWK